jgi:nucleotide-binding universal stress UspA family protein
MKIRRILAPTDFSACSKQGLAYALAFAQKVGAKLSLLHVIELPVFPLEGILPPTLTPTQLEAIEHQATLQLDRLLQLDHLLPEAEAVHVEVARHVVVGPPAHRIIEIATAERVDVIIMATHGRRGFSHLWLGSVAERVVRTAPCPVLTLRPTERG